jgi:hypothetical protein
VVQRAYLARGQTVLVAYNNGPTTARSGGISTNPSANWNAVWGSGTVSANVATLPPVSATVFVPETPFRTGPRFAITLKAGPDGLTSYEALTSTTGGFPASVGFAIRRRGGAWQRVALDDSPPYRAFVDPHRFTKHERVEAVAVARGYEGKTSVSPVVQFTPRP